MSDLMTARLTWVRQAAVRTVLDYSFAAFRIALRTYQTRQALRDLTARELADIGITPTAAVTEAARLPWDIQPRGPRSISDSVIDRPQQALERARTRRILSQMQARELSDIGIGPSGAETEASKPMWRQ